MTYMVELALIYDDSNDIDRKPTPKSPWDIDGIEAAVMLTLDAGEPAQGVTATNWDMLVLDAACDALYEIGDALENLGALVDYETDGDLVATTLGIASAPYRLLRNAFNIAARQLDEKGERMAADMTRSLLRQLPRRSPSTKQPHLITLRLI